MTGSGYCSQTRGTGTRCRLGRSSTPCQLMAEPQSARRGSDVFRRTLVHETSPSRDLKVREGLRGPTSRPAHDLGEFGIGEARLVGGDEGREQAPQGAH